MHFYRIDINFGGSEKQAGLLTPSVFMEHLRTAFEFLEVQRRVGRIRFYGLASWLAFRVPPGACALF